MIEPYWGEFLISPIPLELSLNYCSHKCAYCFANLNDPKRAGDVKAIMRFLASYTERNTLEATLLKSGYPVVVSNRSDPFSYSNYKAMLPILRAMTELEIPVAIQTKGGPGADEALEFLPPSVWYISISMLDDDIRKKIEPGAPSIDSRLRLIERVTQAGGRVILGLNPIVPEWLPNPKFLLSLAKNAGAEAVWIEELHLNVKQIANMSEAEKRVMGSDILERARKKKRDILDKDAFFAARDIAAEMGLPIFSNGQPDYSDIWDIYRQVYTKTFPTNQDFVNYCHTNGMHGKIMPYGLWREKLGDSFPTGRYRMSKYIGASSMSIWEDYNVPSQLSYDELLGIIWSLYRAKQSPARMPSFAYAGLWAENGWIKLVDELDRPYLVFDVNGEFTEYYTRVVPNWGTEG